LSTIGTFPWVMPRIPTIKASFLLWTTARYVPGILAVIAYRPPVNCPFIWTISPLGISPSPWWVIILDSRMNENLFQFPSTKRISVWFVWCWADVLSSSMSFSTSECSVNDSFQHPSPMTSISFWVQLLESFWFLKKVVKEEEGMRLWLSRLLCFYFTKLKLWLPFISFSFFK
jgi:hypothetical protein